ncbi:hypothetical protein MS3_00010149 [Schistosoma haematobium]|uniref:Uncharacterized protein n=1 Tax=Schistosoma haematobium TaxID=6185 RepID=A0A922LWR7_SCHHA|nr:hypothetical protein MS3_00010149 [Schistosoma haematobium]KAH9595332.1 hypothetical protein MS3_00010149 [Schistosoma haematobium]
MCDIFDVAEVVVLAAHKDLASCRVGFIERHDKKVVVISKTFFIFDCDFEVIDSYEHDCNILKVCSPANVVFLFFLDEHGLLNVYLPERHELAFSLLVLIFFLDPRIRCCYGEILTPYSYIQNL